MPIRRTGDKVSVNICKINTTALQKINKKIKFYLDRLPLADQKDVVALNRLIEEQEKLVRVHIREHIPCRIAVFNDNERYRACYLKKRFKEACRGDKIKKPVTV